DILGKIVRRPLIRETTALGAAYLAGLAVGFWKDKEEIMDKWNIDNEYTPNLEKETRQKLYKSWRKAVIRAQDWEEHDA
ncbi:MAG TPA: glycerol kinase, partial [Clostridium sp.]|nr:glycerol kinase [Clostridium sp.]